MSFTRRIAKSALLTAAGAASVVGAAAGSANAVDLPEGPNLGGLSNLDGENLGDGLDSTAQNVTGLAGEAGGEAVKSAVPAAGKAVGSFGKSAVPAAQQAAGHSTGDSAEGLGKALTTVTEGGLPTEALTETGLPTDTLPVSTGSLGGGSIGGIPLGG